MTLGRASPATSASLGYSARCRQVDICARAYRLLHLSHTHTAHTHTPPHLLTSTGVGHQAEQKASNLMSAENDANNHYAFSKKGKLRSLEATNRALADAMELRSVFHDVTNFVEVVT